MRTRSIDRRSPVPKFHIRYFDGVKWIDGYAAQYEKATGSIKTIIDVKTPDFRNRANRGEIIINPLTITSRARSCEPLDSVVLDAKGRPISQQGDATNILEALSQRTSWDTDTAVLRSRNIAVVKAHAKINSASINSAEEIKDFNETVMMLRHPLRSVTEIFKAMQKAAKANFRNARKNRTQGTAIANAWLQYRYGLQPVLMDIDEGIQAVLEARQRMAWSGRVARAGCVFQYGNTKPQQYGGPVGLMNPTTWSLTSSYYVRSSAGIMYSRRHRSTPEYVVATLGLRPRDVPATLWELVPYSFVADWFVNIGHWLQAVCPDPSVTIVGSWVTTVENRIDTIHDAVGIVPAMFTGGVGVRVPIPNSVIISNKVQRIPNPAVPSLPIVTMKPLSTIHALDAIGLLLKPISRLIGDLKH